MDLTTLEKDLVNGWQKGFPLVARPYARIADALGISEERVLEILAGLEARGILSRVGAIVAPNTLGASSLVAMRVARDQLDEVAAIVSSEPGVNHNYEREDNFNLWFVVTAPDADGLDATLARIEARTGHATLRLPLQKAYHIDLGFAL